MICLWGQPRCISSQAIPAASAPIQLSVFGGLTGTNTGLSSGKNAAVTAGIDLGFLNAQRIDLSLELRGSLAIDKGQIDSQKNVLGGLKLATHSGRLHPYGNLLFGRGEIDYGSGYQVPGTFIFYTQSHSNVPSLGGGLDLNLAPGLDLKLDAQIQRYSTPVTLSHHVYADAGTIALVYHVHVRHHAKSKDLKHSR